MRCLCLFIHYFNPQGPFGGRSKEQNPQVRRQIVERALFSLRALRDLDVRVCGHGGRSLVSLDLDLSDRTGNPQFLVFEALQLLQEFRDSYDFFLVVEDDLLLTPDLFHNVQRFDEQFSQSSADRWILHPNRIEHRRGQQPFCIDLAVVRRRLEEPVLFDGRQVQEHENPHSGLLLVNPAKLAIIRQEVDPRFRGSVIGGPMASAFAHYHRPFRLFRFIDGLDRHTIQHLDPMDWQQPSLAERAVRRIRRSFPAQPR
jgi:hypothetical protein